LKKLIAGTLLTVYLFNIGGQLVLHQYFSYLSDKFFNEQINKGQYNIAELTEVKIPVNMPGITDWRNYENIAGQIQFENTSYNYVKMKITKHTLYLMCVPNYSTTHLSNQNLIGAKQVKDAPVHKKEHVPFSKISTLTAKSDFDFLQYTFNPPFKNVIITVLQTVQQVSDHSPDIPEQPPKQVC
jgi:hypothetical protein